MVKLGLETSCSAMEPHVPEQDCVFAYGRGPNRCLYAISRLDGNRRLQRQDQLIPWHASGIERGVTATNTLGRRDFDPACQTMDGPRPFDVKVQRGGDIRRSECAKKDLREGLRSGEQSALIDHAGAQPIHRYTSNGTVAEAHALLFPAFDPCFVPFGQLHRAEGRLDGVWNDLVRLLDSRRARVRLRELVL